MVSLKKKKKVKPSGVVVVVFCYLTCGIAMADLKGKNQNLPVWWWCGGGGVVVWCGGYFTDYNTTLRLHWVTLGCGNKHPWGGRTPI